MILYLAVRHIATDAIAGRDAISELLPQYPFQPHGLFAKLPVVTNPHFHAANGG